eukprot:4285887-Prymnesium_polylepis.1
MSGRKWKKSSHLLATAASTAHQQRSMRNLSISADSPSLAGTSDVDAQRNHRACCSMNAASA